MRKITIKYIVLFLSIAIGQLNAGEAATETPTYRSVKNKIHELWAAILETSLAKNPYVYTTALAKNPYVYTSASARETFEQHIKNLQDYMQTTAIPWIQSKNKALFSNEYINRFSDKLSKPNPLLTESIEKIEVFSKSLDKLITQQFSIEMLDSIIKRLLNQKTELDKEYFFAPDKREARDITLLLYEAIINIYQINKTIIASRKKNLEDEKIARAKVEKIHTKAVERVKKEMKEEEEERQKTLEKAQQQRIAQIKAKKAETERLERLAAEKQMEKERLARITHAKKNLEAKFPEQRARQAQIRAEQEAETKRRERRLEEVDPAEKATAERNIKKLKLELELAKELTPAQKAIVNPEELELARTQKTGLAMINEAKKHQDEEELRRQALSKKKPPTYTLPKPQLFDVSTASKQEEFPSASKREEFPSASKREELSLSGSLLGKENELISIAAETKREEEAKQAQSVAEFLAQLEAKELENANADAYLRLVGTQRKDAPQELGQSQAGKSIFGSPAKLPGFQPTPKPIQKPVGILKPRIFGRP